jgi:hypothetical protein
MALSRDDDVATLIGRRHYAKAIELIKERLKSGPPDPHLRLQLADALVFAGRDREAVMILLLLADEYAKDGFAAKAISVLKKIQKIDPGRRDIEAKLAALIETKQRLAATVPFTPPPSLPEIGMEEIGPGPEIDLDVAAPMPAHRAPVVDLDLLAGDEQALPELSPANQASPITGEIGDDFTLEPLADGEALELDPADVEPLPEGAPAAKPIVDAAFTKDLLSIIDGLFPSGTSAAATPAADEPPVAGRQIVVSPLFKDFSVDEMVAVIQGLKLITLDPRKVILRQGDRGDSLYVLTSGRVRAFVKSAGGKQTPLADIDEGAFFGEMSVLTGKPRNATIVAVTRCELLELDRATLDSIVANHPHVWDVLQEFARQRSQTR